MKCEQAHYCDAKTINSFATNPCVIFELLHANGIELIGSTPNWTFDHRARICDALYH